MTMRKLVIITLQTLAMVFLQLTAACEQGPEFSDSVVVFETTLGPFEASLDRLGAPEAVQNFRCLVRQGLYDGLLIHRVVKGFVIQGGDPTGTGSGGSTCDGQPLLDDQNINLSFADPWTLGMARSGMPNSATSQFFITLGSFPLLDGVGFTAFGTVTDGMSVIQSISEVPVGPGYGGIELSRPLEPIVMKRVWIRGIK